MWTLKRGGDRVGIVHQDIVTYSACSSQLSIGGGVARRPRPPQASPLFLNLRGRYSLRSLSLSPAAIIRTHCKKRQSFPLDTTLNMCQLFPQIQLQYTCVGVNKRGCETMSTQWTATGRGSINFLDRHQAFCRPGQVMTGWGLQLQKEAWRIIYTCCAV
jgi:hypothetical protein